MSSQQGTITKTDLKLSYIVWMQNMTSIFPLCVCVCVCEKDDTGVLESDAGGFKK